jgi:hypothetical protein
LACKGIPCPYKKDRQVLYVDYGHFSTEGSDMAVKALRLGMPSSAEAFQALDGSSIPLTRSNFFNQ